ncbi:heterokaryon incompatibility protein-domain-containing protein [Xylariomycetidae sp. FL0641]|nr:heterokaryon incompatibility protein-domain-containing protein [Xylariomycetidae sp. FL0641]
MAVKSTQIQTVADAVIFTVGITFFGVPWIIPLVLLKTVSFLLFLPLRILQMALDGIQSSIPGTTARFLSAFVVLYRFASALTRSLNRSASFLPRRITDQSVILAVLWPVLNSPVADTAALMLIRARKHLIRPWKSAKRVITMVSAASAQYLSRSVTMGSVLTLFPEHLLSEPISILKRIYWAYKAGCDASREMDTSELSARQQSNAGVYGETRLLGANGAGTYPLGTIRLLQILPGLPSQPVKCVLRTANLLQNHVPTYEALSYVWGSYLSDVNTITVDGKPFQVSPSLHQALVRIRRAQQVRTVWIDAICMNQTDYAERASQVTLMRDVYSKAERVIIWLEDDAPFGLDQILRTGIEAHTIHYGATRVVSRLLERHWWTRVWVIQELVLAREAVILCGQYELGWDAFCHLVRRVRLHPCFLPDRNGIHFEEFQTIEDSRNRKVGDKIEATSSHGSRSKEGDLVQDSSQDILLSLVFDFRVRHATDPRDKVFALQGLVNRPLIRQPDYVKHPSQLTIEFAKEHIRRSRSLSVLALAECVRQRDPLYPTSVTKELYVPSWCPALMNETAVAEGIGLRPLWTGLPEDEDLGYYAAAGNLPLPNEPEINIDGAGCDYKLPITILPHARLRVAKIGSVYNPSSALLREDMTDVLKGRLSSMRSSLDGVLSKDTVFETWRQLAWTDHQKRAGVRNASKPESHPADFEETFNLTLTAGKSSDPLDSAQAILSLREAVCTGRQLFITKCGRFGLGPQGLRIDDEIRVVLGCQVPIAVRSPSVHFNDPARRDSEVKTKYEGEDARDLVYVGQVYVHHLMAYRGDMAGDIASGKVKTESRTLV